MTDAMVSHLTGFIEDMNELKKSRATWSPNTREEDKESPRSETAEVTSEPSDLGGQSSNSVVGSEGGQTYIHNGRNEGSEPSNQSQDGHTLVLRMNNMTIKLRLLRPRV